MTLVRRSLQACLFLTTFLFVFPAVTAQAQPPKTRKIGVSTGLTGNLAAIGAGVRNGILLAGRENDPEAQVQFLIEDDGFDPKRTVGNVLKFIDQDKVDGLIVFGSGTALAVNNIAEQRQIPLIFLGNSKKVIADKKFIMMHFLNTDVENEAVIREVKTLPLKRIAVVASSQDAMLDLSRAFVQSLPERVVMSTELLPSDTDFRATIAQIKSARADAVYNVLLPGGAALFAKQLRSLGFHGELFSSHAVDDWNEIKNSQGALIGTWFVTGNVVEDRNFAARYEKVFHEAPPVAAANAYDAAKLFTFACGAPDVNKYLHEVKDFHGVMGSYGLNPVGYFELKAALRKVTETGFVPLH